MTWEMLKYFHVNITYLIHGINTEKSEMMEQKIEKCGWLNETQFLYSNLGKIALKK